jgi:DNA polymerase-3 subunit epsilon
MRLAFVDLETTGGSPTDDRITEVGIITVDIDERDPRLPIEPVLEWSTLVNPGTPIPSFIQALTGISDDMVASAPSFDQVADEVQQRLSDRLFVAHNARFDHGFLRNAYRRLGRTFRPDVLCTVRLSRKLYPGYARHNLDALIERHRLSAEMRHRALGDARLLWQLWQRLHDALPTADIAQAIDRLTARPTLPRHLDPEVLERLPNTAGVYLFYGHVDDEDGQPRVAADAPVVHGLVGDVGAVPHDFSPHPSERPLYVGKAKNIRQRVLAHFSGDHLSPREMEISQQLRRIAWVETGGGTQQDLGALLLEATLVKRLQPAYNKQLRKNDDVCAWRLVVDRGRRRWRLALARPDDLLFAQDPDLYGPFASPREAGVALRAIADAHGLCPALLRLEKVPAGKPCFAHQVKRCRGACVGLESVEQHTARLREALAGSAMRPWPFTGPFAIREGHTIHWVDEWAFLGHEDARTTERPPTARRGPFDADVYRLLQKRIDTLARHPDTTAVHEARTVSP